MIVDFLFARDFATTRQAWLVVVLPPEAMEAGTIALVATAKGDPFGGRTLALPQGGKVSIACAAEPVFPKGKEFHVMFAGWGGKATQAKEMVRWRTAAKSIVTRAT